METPTPGSSPKIDRRKLRYELLRDESQIPTTFDSGEPEIDDFILTKEALEFERDSEGRTSLVFLNGELVAYYTLSSDSLRSEYVESKKLSGAYKKAKKEKLEVYPALKIGRLGVQRWWHRRGVGTAIVRRVVAIAVRGPAATRFITLRAKPPAVPFYQALGFEMTLEVHRERGKINRTMYLDTLPLRDAVLDGWDYS